ncbi:MAG: ATP synthase F1 subunit epsilon [Thermoanaerobaculia bacterium]
MSDSKTFSCSVVTPEKVVLECEARFVALPAHDGEIGLLRSRAPLVCRLAIGKLRVETEGEMQAFYIDGGFAEMADNELTVLTEDARRAEEIDPAEVEKLLEEARAMETHDVASMEEREKTIQRARAQLRVLGTG